MKILAPLDVTGNPIVNVPTPTAGTDGANKAYVDSKAGGTGAMGLQVTQLSTAANGVASATLLTITGFGSKAGRSYRLNYTGYMTVANSGVVEFRVTIGATTYTVQRQYVTDTLLYYPVLCSLVWQAPADALVNVVYSFTVISGTASLNIPAGSGSFGMFWIEDMGGTAGAYPIGVVGFIEKTVNQSITFTGSPQATDLTVSVPVVAGGRYRVCASTAFNHSGSPSTVQTGYLTNGVASGQCWVKYFPTSTAEDTWIVASLVFTEATGGNRTYSFQFQGSGTGLFAGSATAPRQLWVERIG